MSQADVRAQILDVTEAEPVAEVEITSDRVGTVRVPETEILEMSAPIPGFSKANRYCILPTSEGGDSPFRWFHAVDVADLAFVAINPFEFFPDYDIELPRPDQEELDIECAEEVLLLALVTIPPGEPEKCTANLVAPIVINTRTRRARQVILYESKYTTKHRLLPDPEERIDSEQASEPSRAKAME